MATALVLGSNGQDGSYMAEVLLEQGHEVVGAARQPTSRWIDHPRFRHVQVDVGDAGELKRLLGDVKPSRIAALATVHGPSGHAYETDWRAALDVNLGCIHTCLEYMRVQAPSARLFAASSLKAFGQNPPAVIDESTQRVSSCLYSITKNAAADLVSYYRSMHHLWAVTGFFFNHDSPRRPSEFFLPRLVDQLGAYLGGQEAPPPLATLDFWCDWGSSLEFMRAAAALLALDEPRDVVIATGVSLYARDLAEALSEATGATAESWVKARQAPQPKPPGAEPPYRANIQLLRGLVGQPPSDGLDVALWILRDRYGVDVGRPVKLPWRPN